MKRQRRTAKKEVAQVAQNSPTESKQVVTRGANKPTLVDHLLSGPVLDDAFARAVTQRQRPTP